MRTVTMARLSVLIVLLVVTFFIAHFTSGSSTAKSIKKPLSEIFISNNSWRLVGNYPLDVRVVNELKLDDYLYQSYVRDIVPVSIYIGYYRTAKKVGAAHDPLVCFQGQGWQIKSRESREHILASNLDLKISYSSMIVERQDEQQLIIYWFQSNRKASANTHSQKAAMIIDSFYGRGEGNAFVKISAPLAAEPPEVVRKRMLDFVEGFYPDFVHYITNT